MIVFRYLGKEIYQTCFAISAVLLFVIICNQMIVYLTNAATGGMPIGIVFKIIVIQIPLFLTVLLPLSFFLSILLAYGRMYVESEMVVLGACGYSNARLMLNTLALSMVITVAVGYLTFDTDPKVTAYQYQLQASMGVTTVIQTLMPGRFQSLGDKYVIYVGEMSRDRKNLKDIFIAARRNPSANASPTAAKGAAPWDALVAKWGDFHVDPKTGAEFVVCHDGYYYTGQPGSKDYQVVKFDQAAYWLQNKITDINTKASSVPTLQILKGFRHNLSYAAELQKRISMPLMVPIVVLLAVPLSRVRPRQGKYARVVPAILLYIMYANTILVAQKWVTSGAIPIQLGLWWIHAGMLLIGLGLLIEMYGWQKFWSKLQPRARAAA